MLIATTLLIYFLFFQDGKADPVLKLQGVQEGVTKVVKEPTRADAAAGVLQEIQNSQEAYRKRLTELEAEFLEVDRNYEVAASDYEPLITEVEALQLAHEEDLRRLRVGLKEHVTREEWKRLFK